MSKKLTGEEAKHILDSYLRRHYKIGIDDVEITNTPGCWRIKKPCGGTISFVEDGVRNSKGRFISPYRVWRILRMGIWDLKENEK